MSILRCGYCGKDQKHCICRIYRFVDQKKGKDIDLLGLIKKVDRLENTLKYIIDFFTNPFPEDGNYCTLSVAIGDDQYTLKRYVDERILKESTPK